MYFRHCQKNGQKCQKHADLGPAHCGFRKFRHKGEKRKYQCKATFTARWTSVEENKVSEEEEVSEILQFSGSWWSDISPGYFRDKGLSVWGHTLSKGEKSSFYGHVDQLPYNCLKYMITQLRDLAENHYSGLWNRLAGDNTQLHFFFSQHLSRTDSFLFPQFSGDGD